MVQEAHERTRLFSPAPTLNQPAREDDPASIANPEGALNVRPFRAHGPSKTVRRIDEHTAANQSISALRTICCTFALGCLIFIQATNISMLTTTQSEIANELQAFDKTSWFTSSYLIAMSAPAPLNGKLASVFSPRLCIVAASIVLASGALISSLASSFESFIAGRVITGVGASGVFTISIIIVLELSGSKRKGIAVGLLNSGYTVGVAVGATVAGALVDVIGWRPLFWLQAPVVLTGGSLLYLALPASFTAGSVAGAGSEPDNNVLKRMRRLDYAGAVTLTTALVLMLYALSSPTTIPILPIFLSLLVGFTFVLIEVYWALDPIIPVALLKSRGLLLTCLGTVGYMMARWSVLFYTPTYAIAVRQWHPSIAGALLVPTNGGFAIGGLLVGWLHIRRQGSFYLATLVTYALFPITLVLLATLGHTGGSPVAFVVVLFACGFTTGAALNYNLAHVLHLIPRDTHYVATALLATFRGFAGSFGSAIGGGFFTRTLSGSLTAHFVEHGLSRANLTRRLIGSPALVGKLEGVEHEVAVLGYEEALKALWLAAACLALVTVFVQAGVGWKGSEREGILDEERRPLLRGEQEIDRGINAASQRQQQG